MTYKKFAIALLCTAFLVAAANVAFWHLVTKKTFYEQDGHGDLARIGSFVAAPSITKNITYPNGSHREFQDYLREGRQEHYTVMTVGDSISAGSGGTYYQDYMAQAYGIDSINVIRLFRGEISRDIDVYQTVRLMIAYGYIDEIKPEYLILECGERMISRHFASAIMPLPGLTREEYEHQYLNYREVRGREMIPPSTLLSTTMGAANKQYIDNRLYARSYPDHMSLQVGKKELTIPAFTSQGQENILYYYQEEMDYLIKRPDAEKVNATLNQLAEELAQHGVQLVVMPFADKSDAYYPYVKDADYPENPFFMELRSLDKSYRFIDIKKIMREAIAAGETDLYWGDDTHWSWKGQQVVVDELVKVLAH